MPEISVSFQEGHCVAGERNTSCLEYNTSRFEYVTIYCPYLYYDNVVAAFICAQTGKPSTSLAQCKHCGKYGLKYVITHDGVVDLKEL